MADAANAADKKLAALTKRSAAEEAEEARAYATLRAEMLEKVCLNAPCRFGASRLSFLSFLYIPRLACICVPPLGIICFRLICAAGGVDARCAVC